MFKNILKHSTFFTILILFVYSFSFIFPYFTLHGVVLAEDNINKNDIYKGIGIAVLLIMISRLGQSVESSNSNNTILSEKNKKLSSVKDEELKLLAKLIYAEARGEPFSGQIAVAAVVLNRVKNANFPDTIKEVIYQSGQFTPVNNGQINLVPNNTAYQAAKEALAGRDPSNGALYFYNPKTAKTLWWLDTRKKIATIGNHVFAK